MAKTKIEIADLVLKRLQVTAAGESASAEDAALVTDRYESKHAEWLEDGLANWDVDAVPNFAVASVTTLVALDTMGDFETPQAAQSLIAGLAAAATSTLYRFQSKPNSEAPLQADYY